MVTAHVCVAARVHNDVGFLAVAVAPCTTTPATAAHDWKRGLEDECIDAYRGREMLYAMIVFMHHNEIIDSTIMLTTDPIIALTGAMSSQQQVF